MLWNFLVQSLLLRVTRVTLPLLIRQSARYPSNLISCTQPSPLGGVATRVASCGLNETRWWVAGFFRAPPRTGFGRLLLGAFLALAGLARALVLATLDTHRLLPLAIAVMLSPDDALLV